MRYLRWIPLTFQEGGDVREAEVLPANLRWFREEEMMARKLEAESAHRLESSPTETEVSCQSTLLLNLWCLHKQRATVGLWLNGVPVDNEAGPHAPPGPLPPRNSAPCVSLIEMHAFPGSSLSPNQAHATGCSPALYVLPSIFWLSHLISGSFFHVVSLLSPRSATGSEFDYPTSNWEF
jgi:hypothetical protein